MLGIDTSNPPTTSRTGLVNSSRAFEGLSAGTTYYWKATCTNQYGSSTGDVWSFTTASAGSPPGTPTTPTPADGGTNLATSGTTSCAAAGTPTSWSILGPDATNPPTTNHASLNNCAYAYSGLSDGTTYYWKVTATNASGSTAGPVWSFTTVSGGGQSVISSADWTFKGGMRFRDPSAIGAFNAASNASAMMVRCLDGSNATLACSSGSVANFEVFWVGNIGNDGRTHIMHVVSGGTTTSATVAMDKNTAPPATNTWLYVTYGCCGTQNIPVQITSSVANGSNFDITWSPALPGSLGALTSGYLFTSDQLLYSCRFIGTGSLSTSATVTSWSAPAIGQCFSWGDPYGGKRYTTDSGITSASAVFTESLLYLEDGTNDFFFGYKPNYAAQNNNPFFARCHLDDATHTITTCGGPWFLSATHATVPPNFMSGNIFKFDSTWATTNLGNATCYGFGSAYSSGTPMPTGTTLYALCGSAVPTTAMTANTAGTAFATTEILYFDDTHRMARDNDYVPHYGNIPWTGQISSASASSMTVTANATALDAGTVTYPGLSFPTSIYWGSDSGGSVASGYGTVTGHTATTISFTKTSGVDPVNGQYVFDVTNTGSGLFTLNAVKRTTAALADWSALSTPGTTQPAAGSGWFGTGYDYGHFCLQVSSTNRKGLLCANTWADGNRWYGVAYQSGTGQYCATGQSQGYCAERHRVMLTTWNPDDLAAIVSGGLNPWSKTYANSTDLAGKSMVQANETVNYPTKSSPPIVAGSIWAHTDLTDATKTLILMLVPVIDSTNECVGCFHAALEAFWIPK